jgi:hypothetical protein
MGSKDLVTRFDLQQYIQKYIKEHIQKSIYYLLNQPTMTTDINTLQAYANVIYLTLEERNQFLSLENEYLIEQIKSYGRGTWQISQLIRKYYPRFESKRIKETILPTLGDLVSQKIIDYQKGYLNDTINNGSYILKYSHARSHKLMTNIILVNDICLLYITLLNQE